MQELIEIINSVGFPIAMVCYFIYDKNKSMQLLASTIASNTDSINKNTTILEKLLTKLNIEDI